MKRRNIYWIIAILVFLSLIILAISTKPIEKPLKVIMLDIGQGDSIYIETPHGQNMLVDSGRDRTVLSKISPYMGLKNKIDIIENSNPDLDHIGGFPFIMEKYQIGRIISAGTNHEELDSFKKIEELAKEKDIPVEIPKEGTVYIIDKESNITYTILWPEGNVRNWERNSGSIVGLLEYGEHKVLLTGDAPKEVEDQIVAKYEKALEDIDILKVGHHGSRTATGERLISIAHPKYAIISAGLNNRYGHPHKETTNLLEKFNITTLVTLNNGTIECNIFLEKEVSCK